MVLIINRLWMLDLIWFWDAKKTFEVDKLIQNQDNIGCKGHLIDYFFPSANSGKK